MLVRVELFAVILEKVNGFRPNSAPLFRVVALVHDERLRADTLNGFKITD